MFLCIYATQSTLKFYSTYIVCTFMQLYRWQLTKGKLIDMDGYNHPRQSKSYRLRVGFVDCRQISYVGLSGNICCHALY